MSNRRKNLVSNDPVGFIVLFKHNIDPIIAELKKQFYEKRSGYITDADIYQDILKEIKNTDHQPLFAKIDITKWTGRYGGWGGYAGPYDEEKSGYLYVELDEFEIKETIKLFEDFKLNLDQNPSINLILYKQDTYFRYIRYEYKLGGLRTKYIIYKIYKRSDDLFNDQFKLLANDVIFTINNNMIIYEHIVPGEPLSSVLNIRELDNKQYEDILIDYNKMFKLDPVGTGRYLMRNFDDVVYAAPILINEPYIFPYLLDAIVSYIDTHPESGENKKLYYYLGMIEYDRPDKTNQDKMKILSYFIAAGDFENSKRYREIVFNDLVGLPSQTSYPFDFNLNIDTLMNIETLVNFSRFLLNK